MWQPGGVPTGASTPPGSWGGPQPVPGSVSPPPPSWVSSPSGESQPSWVSAPAGPGAQFGQPAHFGQPARSKKPWLIGCGVAALIGLILFVVVGIFIVGAVRSAFDEGDVTPVPFPSSEVTDDGQADPPAGDPTGPAGDDSPTPGDTAGEPFTYGDDPELDALWDQCEAGDGVACDELYMTSPFDSEYEAFGDSCAGRGRDGMWCADEG